MSSEKHTDKPARSRFGGLSGLFRRNNAQQSSDNDEYADQGRPPPPTWSMGVLNDRKTVEVPGSVLLLAAHRNEPLGLRNVHARTSHSSIPAGFAVDVPTTPGGTRRMPESPGGSTPTNSTAPTSSVPTSSAPLANDHARRQASPSPRPGSAPAAEAEEEKKMTDDGEIILDPQPDDSANDPLNWPTWRRDMALGSLGIYCMIGGGITPLIAAGFTNVAETYSIDVHSVALTTGLYMMGLGIGSVIFSPTAILYGKRPVYLFSSILFIGTSLWAGWSPTFNSLLAARVFQGIAVSPVECLPSATIAEIFFLHERAYRIGIYTLLLLGGKNLVPLVSAAVIGRFGWRWTFWITAMIVAVCGILLFFFVPETFWDRTPSRKPHKRPSFLRRLSSRRGSHGAHTPRAAAPVMSPADGGERPVSPGATGRAKDLHVGFAPENTQDEAPGHYPIPGGVKSDDSRLPATPPAVHSPTKHSSVGWADEGAVQQASKDPNPVDALDGAGASREGDAVESPVNIAGRVVPTISVPRSSVDLHRSQGEQGPASPTPRSQMRPSTDVPRNMTPMSSAHGSTSNVDYFARGPNLDNEKIPASDLARPPKIQAYTHNLRQLPAQSFTQQLKPYHGRLNNDKWIKVMIRPFILFAYPAILWSAIVYACSIGWLIVISETMAVIYRDPESYNFTALQTGLVYISPFVGGILGTGVAGKISDIIVKSMSRRNGGLYEPEFRLVMAAPILLTTCIGLMGFGWSAEQKDNWIVPTIFFGVVSFGCSLGSTTSITFCVDSYRQYAGEALVTLNFAKNVCHGLVFSLFVAEWMEEDGPRAVYIWIGVIQLIVMLFTIPMYIYGKRARMWTVRKNFMEKF